LGTFRKTVGKIQVSLKSDKNNGYFTWRPLDVFDHISLSSSHNEKYFRKKVVEEIKMHILCSITVFRKSCHLWDNVKNVYRTGQTIDDMAYARCTPRNQGYTHTHTLTVCNTYCFPAATMVARIRLNVTLYVKCMSCYT
jgi:hypothetical protein